MEVTPLRKGRQNFEEGHAGSKNGKQETEGSNRKVKGNQEKREI